MFSMMRCTGALCLVFLFLIVALSVFGRETRAVQSPSGSETHPSSSVTPANSAGTLLLSKTFTLSGSKVWTDTGITLQPGQRVAVTADGKLRYSDAKTDNRPEGLTRGYKDLIRILPLNSQGHGALIARIGAADVAEPFFVGASKDSISPVSG